MWVGGERFGWRERGGKERGEGAERGKGGVRGGKGSDWPQSDLALCSFKRGMHAFSYVPAQYPHYLYPLTFPEQKKSASSCKNSMHVSTAFTYSEHTHRGRRAHFGEGEGNK